MKKKKWNAKFINEAIKYMDDHSINTVEFRHGSALYIIAYNEEYDNGERWIDDKNGRIMRLTDDEISVGIINFLQVGEVINKVAYLYK